MSINSQVHQENKITSDYSKATIDTQ
uniref:Uncharacterized protein n=1 Tax=Tetranychus urticae TaxID=32264 RepID=T1K3N6_TETUR